jgi:hypothetical protein
LKKIIISLRIKMNLLKEEIERKRKELEDAKLMVNVK